LIIKKIFAAICIARWNKITNRIPLLEGIIVKVWNGGIKITLINIYVRLGRNEFHWMLNMDDCLMVTMNESQAQDYLRWLLKKREIIHLRTL